MVSSVAELAGAESADGRTYRLRIAVLRSSPSGLSNTSCVMTTTRSRSGNTKTFCPPCPDARNVNADRSP